MTLSDILLGG